MFLLSRVLHPARHLQGTHIQPFHGFSGPSFSALVPLRYLSTIPTLNTFVPLTQWSTSYSPLFVGKTYRVISRLVRLAVDLATLHPLAYPRSSSGLPSHAPRTSHSIKEARQAPTSPWSPHGARCQCKVERPHVYGRSCQDCCKLAYSSSQRGNSHPKCIRTISRLGASDPTAAQADAAIRRQFQEAHGPSP